MCCSWSVANQLLLGFPKLELINGTLPYQYTREPMKLASKASIVI
jgi:hypothetical protein